MKSPLAICLGLGIMLAPMVAGAADADTDRSSARTYVKDSAITAKVKARLATDKMSSLAKIKVDTDRDGVVYLSGTVASQSEAERAVTVARETEGVRTVQSDLKVSPSK
ncbi:MAG TPA: BON domain-containing protein [Azonexus sp.]|nr:BON domain-containing protein [Azonexus sp.]